MNISHRRWLIFFGLCLVVWTIGLLTPRIGQSSVGSLGSSEVKFYFSKLLHIGAYAVLALMAGQASSSRRLAWTLLIILSLHAGLTEYLQLFVERGGSIRDVGLDHLGIALGVAVGWRRWRVLLRESEVRSEARSPDVCSEP